MKLELENEAAGDKMELNNPAISMKIQSLTTVDAALQTTAREAGYTLSASTDARLECVNIHGKPNTPVHAEGSTTK